MKPEEYLELFAPFSLLYNRSALYEKISKIEKLLDSNDNPDIQLRDWQFKIEDGFKIEIPKSELIIACGIYLDATYIHGLLYQPTEKLSATYSNSFTNLKNGRSKEHRKLNSKMMVTREFFDFGGAEGNSSTLDKKRDKLKKIFSVDELKPSEVFFYHFHSYSSMKNYGHVIEEAPFSCFALCFEKGKFLIPDIKEFYNQTVNLDKMKELDFKKYAVSN